MSRRRSGEAVVFAFGAHHTDAIHEHAGEYERRMVGFLDKALL